MESRSLSFAAILARVTLSDAGHAACDRFTGSTMAMPGVEAAAWRTDYPTTLPDQNKPWL
jgi:hypothetical protein